MLVLNAFYTASYIAITTTLSLIIYFSYICYVNKTLVFCTCSYCLIKCLKTFSFKHWWVIFIFSKGFIVKRAFNICRDFRIEQNTLNLPHTLQIWTERFFWWSVLLKESWQLTQTHSKGWRLVKTISWLVHVASGVI